VKHHPCMPLRHREFRENHAAKPKLILDAADGWIAPRVANHEAARINQTRNARKIIWRAR
jgi:hypothetical protein